MLSVRPAALATVLLVALPMTTGCKRLAHLRPGGGPSRGTPAAAEAPALPDGYLQMTVLRLVPTPHGSAVLLGDAMEGPIVPIFVGGTEAMSIELRSDGQRYVRPLTHDLLDDLVDKLGGELVKVHVDDIKNETFVGRVYVRQNGRVIDVDARPSDAIALALGSHVPIFVSKRVVDLAGVRRTELGGGEELPPTIRDRSHPEPMSL